MAKKCKGEGCRYASFCEKSEQCAEVTKESKKGIANTVAHMICSDWQIPSASSLLESDGRRLESTVQKEQIAGGGDPCFKAPY